VSCTLGCSSDSCSGLSYRESGRIRSLSNAHKFAAPSDNLAPVVGHRLRLGWLVAMVLIIGTLQYLATSSQMAWLYILQRLYYIPVLLAGLIIGWRGGLGVALLAGAGFAIGTPSIWTANRVDALDQCLEICVFCLVGGLSGALTDRYRKQGADLRRTTNQLRKAHQELESNFERMKRAERIYALAQLSAGLAHEIRTPLASLEGAAALVQREIQSEERRREFLDIIQKESRRLNRLLTSFLEFARPRKPDLQRVEVGEVLDSVILLVQHAGDTSRLELRKQIEPGLPMLECDPEQLKQVLLNLVTNASQAMPHGGTVLLEAHHSGSSINIDVHDQGGGIDEENPERIFDPFFTTKESGTGLGLSVAHQIVSQHAGTMTILRNTSHGVTVRVSLPLKPGQV
jgi:two-component system sensor histidine kinase HydH